MRRGDARCAGRTTACAVVARLPEPIGRRLRPIAHKSSVFCRDVRARLVPRRNYNPLTPGYPLFETQRREVEQPPRHLQRQLITRLRRLTNLQPWLAMLAQTLKRTWRVWINQLDVSSGVMFYQHIPHVFPLQVFNDGDNHQPYGRLAVGLET